MYEQTSLQTIFTEEHFRDSILRVSRKKVLSGSDDMRPNDLPSYWESQGVNIRKSLKEGSYRPAPLLSFHISKNGTNEKRQICVSSVLDKMIEHCILIDLERQFTPTFHPNSFGFIRGKGTQDALEKCLEYLNAGLTCIVDIDIRKCFDSIKHHIVLGFMRQYISKEVSELIMKYLKNPVMLYGRLQHRRVGLPQGSCISPILANIVLNRVDWFLEKENIRFVRYADDLVAFCSTRAEAEKAMDLLDDYLKSNLSLSLNKEKSKITEAESFSYLGHAFIKKEGQYHMSVESSALTKLMYRIKRASLAKSNDITALTDLLGAINRGWLNYYKSVNELTRKRFLRKIDDFELVVILNNFRKHRILSDERCEYIAASKGYVSFSEWAEELRERGKQK